MAETLVNDFGTFLANPLPAASGAGTKVQVTTPLPASYVGSSARFRLAQTQDGASEIVVFDLTSAGEWTVVSRQAEDPTRFPAADWPAGTVAEAVLTRAGFSAILLAESPPPDLSAYAKLTDLPPYIDPAELTAALAGYVQLNAPNFNDEPFSVTGNPAADGVNGPGVSFFGGTGGPGTGVFNGGLGGGVSMRAGVGGDRGTGPQAGQGGSYLIRAGDAGKNGGAFDNLGGSVDIRSGVGTTSGQITLRPGGLSMVNLSVGSGSMFFAPSNPVPALTAGGSNGHTGPILQVQSYAGVVLWTVSAAGLTTTNGLTVTKSGGVAGTDEVQLSHDGNNGRVESKDGALNLVAPNGTNVSIGTTFAGDNLYVGGASVTIGSAVTDFRKDGYGSFTITNPTLQWPNGGPDVGLTNAAAGLLKVTNGGGGYGKITARRPFAAKVGAYALTDTDEVIVANAAGGAFAVTLPTAVGRDGRQYTLKKTDASANAVTLTPQAGQTIDGAANLPITVQYVSVTVISDGANWYVI